jgi:biopolymer transport protein ExbD
MEIKSGKHDVPRIDFTPMVDLGFLLITFFLFTTTMTRPKAMDIDMPYKDAKNQGKPTEVKNDVALTFVLSKHHRLFYYEGIGSDPANPPDIHITYFRNKTGIRQVILKKKQSVQSLINRGILKSTDKTTVLIKPDSNSTTDDLVNILDEMTISAISVYAVVDITQADRSYIQKMEAVNQ